MQSRSDSKNLTTKSVGEIVHEGMKFFIPSYQRGYRWEPQQVTALLNDLVEFENSFQTGRFYCLQPLVVFRKNDNEWEVVDGQQRLTTIFLILHKLVPGQQQFTVRYERYPELHFDLEKLACKASAIESPDLHFIRQAEQAIEQWRSKNADRKLESLMNLDGKCVKFIWHCIESREEAMRSFTRLNGGKIKLLDAELIRATLVRSDGQNEAERQRIALRWDDIERRLQEPEFWAFLTGEVNNSECRMDWLLRLTAPEQKSAKNAADHAVFEWFLTELVNRRPSQLWEEVESYFGTLEEWFEDNELFHLTGYLIHHGGYEKCLRPLLSSAREHGKDDFRIHLRCKIRNTVFGNLCSSAEISGHLEKITYAKHPQDVHKVLELFNLAAILSDPSATIRFSFHAFQKQDWDIEHIHAPASRLPENEAEFKGAFESLHDYFERRNCQDDLDKTKQLLIDLPLLWKHDPTKLSADYMDLCRQFSQGTINNQTELADSEIDKLWNLTLLDATTNRGYGNSPFAVKRGWILGLNQSERYILPCTRNVFTKAYSDEPVNLLHWTRNDAEDYKKAIQKRLDDFFRTTWDSCAAKVEPLSKRQSSLAIAQKPKPTTGIPSQPKSGNLSFLQLFHESIHPRVEIPLLQRDYAQGRASAARVRTAFLKSLHGALVGGSPLNLDFIYGEYYDGRFLPIDGQQRLTTLFLLHWFLAGATNQNDDFRRRMRDKEGEARFRYSVRQSSQRFFNALLDTSIDIAPSATKPSSQIIRQPWFYLTWNHDPTIKGALNMIDAIADEFKNTEHVKAFYGKLSALEESPITFDVLDLGSLGQSEEIYIKMNARGVELTGFENFKAWLIETHESRDHAEIQDHWKMQMDGQWLDLFWYFHHAKPQPSATISTAFFRTFVTLAVNVRAAEENWNLEWLEESTTNNPAEWKDLFTEACVKQVFEQLELLSDWLVSDSSPAIIALRQRLGNNRIAPFDGKPLLEPFFEKPAEKLTLEKRVWLHATCLALDASWPPNSSQEMHWFRVVRNLLEHSSFDRTNYGNAIKALNTLANSARVAGSLLLALAEGHAIEVTALNRGQLSEECMKADKILSPGSGLDWEQAIIAIESRSVFQGQIEILLRQETDLEIFRNRCSMAEKLWNDQSLAADDGEHLLARAILASSQRFDLRRQGRIRFSETDACWRSLMSRQEGWPSFRNAVSLVLDSLHAVEDIESALRAQIKSSRVTEPWMRSLIEHGDLLLKSSNGKVQKYYDNGVFVYENPANTNDAMDILIDKMAPLRNRLVQDLTKTGEWTFPSGPEGWREVRISDSEVFYRGHRIQLKKSLPGDECVICEFGYDRLTVRAIQKGESHEKGFPYPQDALPESFCLSLTSTGSLHCEAISNVIDELLLTCTSLSQTGVSHGH